MNWIDELRQQLKQEFARPQHQVNNAILNHNIGKIIDCGVCKCGECFTSLFECKFPCQKHCSHTVKKTRLFGDIECTLCGEYFDKDHPRYNEFNERFR